MIYDTIKVLALPPASLVLLILAGFALRRRWRRLGLAMILLGAAGLYALSTPFVASRLLVALEAAAIDTGGDAPQPGAIVVLSAGYVYGAPDGDSALVDPLTLDRLRRGVRLQRATGLPILVTGGTTRHQPVPMGVLMQQALQRDFRSRARWVETAAGTTFENARNSARLLQAAGIDTVYLVTQAWHLPRALAAYRAAGLAAVAAPASFHHVSPLEATAFLPQASGLFNSFYAIHETLGLIWYRLALFGRPA